MRLIRLKIVLLPAPLGPTMAKISPFLTPKVTPSTARMPPKEMEMSRASNSGRSRAPSRGAGSDRAAELASITLTARAPS